MAYGRPLLCAWIRFILRHAKRDGRQGSVGGRSEATGKEPTVVRRLGLCGEGVGHRLVSGVVSAPLRYYLSFTLRFALFYSPCIFG